MVSDPSPVDFDAEAPERTTNPSEVEPLLQPSGSGSAPSSESDPSVESPLARRSHPLKRDAEDIFHFRAPVGLVHVCTGAAASDDLFAVPAATVTDGFVTVVERDIGGDDDLYAIALTLHWNPAEKETEHHEHEEADTPLLTQSSLQVAVDDLIALRVLTGARPAPRAVLYATGGIRVAVLVFGAGKNALKSFIDAMKAHVSMKPIEDRLAAGDLFALQSHTRIRRVVPALDAGEEYISGVVVGQAARNETDVNREEEDDTTIDADPSSDQQARSDASGASRDVGHASLQDGASVNATRRNDDSVSGLHDESSRRHSHRPRSSSNDPSVVKPAPPVMLVLEQFARVPQFGREVGDYLARMFNDKRRAEEAERAERERKARERALDLFADFGLLVEHYWDDDGDDDEINEANSGNPNGSTASSRAEGFGADRVRPPRMLLKQLRGIPVSLGTWESSFRENRPGVLSDPTLMRFAIFSGGIEKEARAKVWPFLLGVLPWNSTEEQRRVILEKNVDQYAKLKSQWLDLKSDATAADIESLAAAMENLGHDHLSKRGNSHGNGSKASTAVPDRRQRVSKQYSTQLDTEEQIAKDIVRTDRVIDIYKEDNSRMLAMMGDVLNVYAVYNSDIGYCQGMSDFLSPLLYVFGEHEEALTFWCFEALMQRVQLNFRTDQSGMNAQLSSVRKLLEHVDHELYDYFADTDPDFYCVFRWMLVWFKRELPFEFTARLWEVMWSRHMAGDRLQIYIAVGLLRAHRQYLLKLDRAQFDKLLRYISDMCMRIDVDFALRQGELCYQEYGHLPLQ